MNFGPSAKDYAKHRQTFPESFFERVPLTGDVLDLGTGTGSLARGFQQRGARVVASDISIGMLQQAEGLSRRVVARAEACPFPKETFDAVTAGQCWHWFDGPKAAIECHRILKPGGTLVIAHFNYLPHPSTVAFASEALILERNPHWGFAGIRRMEGAWDDQLIAAGFEGLSSFTYELDLQYTHADWRGRMRACHGVLALGAEKIAEYDAALARLLAEQFSEPLVVRHEVFCLRASRAH